ISIFWHLGGDVDIEFECTLSKFVNNTKLCVAAGTLVGRDVTQRDFEKWACRREMDPIKFHKSKYKVLHMDQGNPKHKYRLCRQSNDSSSENDTQLLVDKKVSMASQCVFPAQKDNHILGYFKSMTSRSRWLVLPLCSGFDETPSGCLHPALGISAQDRFSPTGASPEDPQRSSEEWTTSLMKRELKELSSQEKRMLWETLEHLPISKGATRELVRGF
ncbi:hypothetical protein HGM15179_001401, partial [Zosterops borbonicus]